MKRLIILAATLIAGLSACDSLLDKEPLDRVTQFDYFKTRSDLELFSNPFYDNLLDKTPYDEQNDLLVPDDPLRCSLRRRQAHRSEHRRRLVVGQPAPHKHPAGICRSMRGQEGCDRVYGPGQILPRRLLFRQGETLRRRALVRCSSARPTKRSTNRAIHAN